MPGRCRAGPSSAGWTFWRGILPLPFHPECEGELGWLTNGGRLSSHSHHARALWVLVTWGTESADSRHLGYRIK